MDDIIETPRNAVRSKPKGPDYSHVTPDNPHYMRAWQLCMDDARLDVDYTTLKESFVNWASVNRPQEELGHWQLLDTWQYATIGKIAWAVEHGAVMPDSVSTWFNNKLLELLEVDAGDDDEELERKLGITQKRNIEYMQLYSNIEAIWWKFKDNQEEIETRVTKLLKQSTPNQQMLKRLYDHFKGNFDDASKDRLNPFSAEKLEPLITVVNILATSTGNAKAIRDSRGASNKSVRQASKVKLKTVDMDTGVASLSPAMIPSSTIAIIYNAKDRKVMVYYAKPNSVLGIKNTKIVDYDEQRSFAKTLRKPNDILPSLRSAVTTRRIDVIFEDIKGKNHEVNGRMSKDMLLLKVFK